MATSNGESEKPASDEAKLKRYAMLECRALAIEAMKVIKEISGAKESNDE